MITLSWCVLTLFAVRPEFQACQSIKLKNLATGDTGGCGPNRIARKPHLSLEDV